jgi:hypothetical protein
MARSRGALRRSILRGGWTAAPVGFGLLLVAWLAGCCTRHDDLSTPTFEVDLQRSDFCSESIVIDAENRVWSNRSCEGGSNCFDARGSIDVATRQDLDSRADVARSEAVDPAASCPPADGFSSFSIVRSDDTVRRYCRASASAATNAIVDQVLLLAP